MESSSKLAKAIMASAVVVLVSGCASQTELDKFRSVHDTDIQSLRSEIEKIGKVAEDAKAAAEKASAAATAASAKADKIFRESLRK